MQCCCIHNQTQAMTVVPVCSEFAWFEKRPYDCGRFTRPRKHMLSFCFHFHITLSFSLQLFSVQIYARSLKFSQKICVNSYRRCTVRITAHLVPLQLLCSSPTLATLHYTIQPTYCYSSFYIYILKDESQLVIMFSLNQQSLL